MTDSRAIYEAAVEIREAILALVEAARRAADELQEIRLQLEAIRNGLAERGRK